MLEGSADDRTSSVSSFLMVHFRALQDPRVSISTGITITDGVVVSLGLVLSLGHGFLQ